MIYLFIFVGILALDDVAHFYLYIGKEWLTKIERIVNLIIRKNCKKSQSVMLLDP